MRRLLIAILAACGGARAPLDNHGGTPPPRPLGAGMFEAGHTWRYQADTIDEKGARVHAIVTCRVDEVEPIPQGKKSVVACDGKLPAVVDGVWALTARGLYYLGEPPGDDFDEGDLVIGATPVEGEHDEQFEEGSIDTTIRRDGSTWCVDDIASSIGDEDTTTACYDADGIVGGSEHDENDDPSANHDQAFARVAP